MPVTVAMILVRRIEALFNPRARIAHMLLLLLLLRLRMRKGRRRRRLRPVPEEGEGEIGDGDAAEDEGEGEDLSRAILARVLGWGGEGLSA